jgi:hypothetical protein
MKRTRTFFSLLMISLAVVWAGAGCDNAADTDTANDVSTRTETVNLDDAYGGYSTADESAAFGDASLAANFGPDGDIAVDENVDTTRTDRRRPHRYLMITWGNLRADSLIDFPTDWTGGLCAENAVVVVKRLIRFDPRDQLLPRTSRACVEWVSHTQPHFDGILVELLPMRCDSLDLATVNDRPCLKAMSVTFKTGPLTVTIDENELQNLHRVVTVDDAGNAVAFNSFVRVPGECANGFLAGQWQPVDDERIDGRFRGKWVSETGVHMGYLRGIYGVNGNGRPVFFGKWVTEGGRFQGLLAGRYGVNPSTSAAVSETNGWFEGVWYRRNLRVGGGLGGVWCVNDDANGGYFRGRWSARCL